MPDEKPQNQATDWQKLSADLGGEPAPGFDFDWLLAPADSNRPPATAGPADHPPMASYGFTPENVAMVVSLLGAAVGVTTVVLKGVEAWLNDRANRKLRVKYKDFEIELSGPLSEVDIKRRLAVLDHISESLTKDRLIIEKIE